MKNQLSRYLISISLVLAGSVLGARGQSYSIDWFKISGGGGTSSAGQYEVSGTIGQHDAGGPLTGGTYSLVGGFWSPLVLIQTAGAPELSIFLTATNTAVISWPRPSTGWSLQQNSDLKTSNWVSPTQTVNHDASNNFIVVSSIGGNQFYRLSKP